MRKIDRALLRDVIAIAAGLLGIAVALLSLARGCQTAEDASKTKGRVGEVSQVASQAQRRSEEAFVVASEVTRSTKVAVDKVASAVADLERRSGTLAERPRRIALVTPAIAETARWTDAPLVEWLKSSKVGVGDNPGSSKYRLVGKAADTKPGATIAFDILTNKWWHQGRAKVEADGSWKGLIHLDDAHPPITLRLTLQEGKATSVREFRVAQ
ncbi:MAG: hypothetical protein WC683_10420 [bacterium]